MHILPSNKSRFTYTIQSDQDVGALIGLLIFSKAHREYWRRLRNRASFRNPVYWNSLFHTEKIAYANLPEVQEAAIDVVALLAILKKNYNLNTILDLNRFLGAFYEALFIRKMNPVTTYANISVFDNDNNIIDFYNPLIPRTHYEFDVLSLCEGNSYSIEIKSFNCSSLATVTIKTIWGQLALGRILIGLQGWSQKPALAGPNNIDDTIDMIDDISQYCKMNNIAFQPNEIVPLCCF
jgi:hypothetical protein